MIRSPAQVASRRSTMKSGKRKRKNAMLRFSLRTLLGWTLLHFLWQGAAVPAPLAMAVDFHQPAQTSHGTASPPMGTAESLEGIRASENQREYVDRLREGTLAERMEAARALAIREKEPVLALIQALKQERDDAVRVEIVTALGKAVKDTASKQERTLKLDVQQEVFNVLLDAMREEVPQVTLVAIEAIRGMNPSWIRLFAHPERLQKELALQLGSKQLVLMKSKETALQLRRATIELLADRWDVLTGRQKDAFLVEHGGHLKARVSVGLYMDDPASRAAAARLLSDLGDTDCIPRLIELLRARKSVGVMASSLARLRADAAVPDLIEIGKRSQDPQAKLAIVKALGEIGNSRALDFLIATAQEGQPTSRAEALRALMRIEDARALAAVIAAAQDGPGALRIEAVHALTASADERAVGVLAHAFKEAVDFSVRGHRILPFTDEDQRHRFVRSIATTLARRGTPEAMEALGQGLQCSGPRVRANIVYLMKSSPSPRAPGILMDALSTEKHDLIRRDIIVVLGELRSREALPTLRAARAAEEEQWRGRERVRPRDEHDAAIFLWAAITYDRSDDRSAVVKRDLSELPGPGNDLALPDPYAASADYYLGDVIRQAIARIEGKTRPQTSALRVPPP